jgi:NAD(P)-dependent dehydrogenase (short-subunit alcohol dehydrogenase family)
VNAELRDGDGALDLGGKVAVVTGAASGIGLGLSRRLAYEGAHVLMVDVSPERLDAAVAGLRAVDLDVEGLATDVADEAAVEQLANRAFNVGAVAVVCLNAGVPGPLSERTWEVPLDEWDKTIRVDMWGPIIGAASFVRRLLEQGTPSHLLFTISQAGLYTNPLSTPYFASKHAVYALATILHDQLVESCVRVSAICPGAVRTPLLQEIRDNMQRATESGSMPADGRIDPRRKTLAPSQVARAVANAIGTPQFHVMMNPEYRHFYEEHAVRVLAEWPEPPVQRSVRESVERFLAAFESATVDDIRGCFRADSSQHDSEPIGLGSAPLAAVTSLVRRARFASAIDELDGGHAEVRWTATMRESGQVAATGLDVFTGDSTSIWTAASSHPIEGTQFGDRL